MRNLIHNRILIFVAVGTSFAIQIGIVAIAIGVPLDEGKRSLFLLPTDGFVPEGIPRSYFESTVAVYSHWSCTTRVYQERCDPNQVVNAGVLKEALPYEQHGPNWGKLRELDDRAGLIAERAVGWPVRCLAWHAYVDTSQTGGGAGEAEDLPVVIGGLALKPIHNTWIASMPRILPCRVLLSGLCIDVFVGSLCIGATLLYGHCVMFRIRGARRALRGLCRVCGYPRMGAGRCPECGRDDLSPNK